VKPIQKAYATSQSRIVPATRLAAQLTQPATLHHSFCRVWLLRVRWLGVSVVVVWCEPIIESGLYKRNRKSLKRNKCYLMVFFPGGWLPLLILAPQGFILTVWVQLCWLTPAACFSPLTSPCTTVFATAATENYFSPRVRGFQSAPEIFSECKFKIALTGEFLAEPVATSSIRVVSVLVVLTATHNPAGTSYQVYSLGCCSRQGGILGGYHRKSHRECHFSLRTRSPVGSSLRDHRRRRNVFLAAICFGHSLCSRIRVRHILLLTMPINHFLDAQLRCLM
jgi:hypothetical protein